MVKSKILDAFVFHSMVDHPIHGLT